MEHWRDHKAGALTRLATWPYSASTTTGLGCHATCPAPGAIAKALIGGRARPVNGRPEDKETPLITAGQLRRRRKSPGALIEGRGRTSRR